MNSRNIAEEVMIMAREKGILRVRDLTAQGIHPEYLRRLVAKGMLVQSGRGLYSPVNADVSSHHMLAEANKRIPKGVICLLSALRFHEIGTQAPHEVWMALERSTTGRPRVDYPPLRFVTFSHDAFTQGIEEHLIDGVDVSIYNVPKTVADCFKYRNKTGIDVAIEALKDCRQYRKCTVDDLWHYARICRVTRVMKPYLEAVG